MPAEDMSDEDVARFESHRKALDELRATADGPAFLASVEAVAEQAAGMILEAGKLLAPIALEALKSFALAAMEKELNKLAK